MTIGQRIKAAREAADMTQEHLGRVCGITKQAVYKYEAGIVTNIPIDRLERIAQSLGVSSAYLMGWEKETPAPISEGERPDPTIARIMDIVRQLPPDTQERCLEYFESLLALQNTAQAPRTPD